MIDPEFHPDLSLGLLLQRWLMASYLYYVKDISITDDHSYDATAKHLLENFNHFDHRHKHLVDELDLAAGTLYELTEEKYPSIVKNAAVAWARRKNLIKPGQD